MSSSAWIFSSSVDAWAAARNAAHPFDDSTSSVFADVETLMDNVARVTAHLGASGHAARTMVVEVDLEKQVEREQRWLPWLAPRLPLAVSQPVAQGKPGEGYPFPWSVCRWLDGEVATTDGLADPRRTAVELGEFVTALRAIDATGGPEPQWSNAFRGARVGAECDALTAEPFTAWKRATDARLAKRFGCDVSELVVVRLNDARDRLVIESWHEGRGYERIKR